MVKNKNIYNLDQILWVSAAVGLIFTPWYNLDSLILPKIALLFALAMYLLPNLLTNISFFSKNATNLILITLAILFILQMIFAMLFSSAPIEQQVFGRFGRGLGFITYFSTIVIMLGTALHSTISRIKSLQFAIFITGLLSSVYAVLQYYGLDFFEWATRTNGIIGTLGNPNFQSSFTALVFLPSLAYIWSTRKNFFTLIALIILFLFTIYVSGSTQGYIILITTACLNFLILLWYKSKKIFYVFGLTFLFSILLVILGMLNKGPLSYYLFKVSVTSRGEFWETAFSAIKNNPFFGVGIDSFGDFSQFYKSQSTYDGVNEFTDNAHNYFLEFAVTGGVLLAVLYFAILFLALVNFYNLQKRIGKYDLNLTSIFCFWIGFQMQSLISPGSISLIFWNFIICGFIIGANSNQIIEPISKINQNKSQNIDYFIRPFSFLLILFSLAITYPLFKADNSTLRALQTADATLAVKSVLTYPESTVRYSRISQELLQSKLWPQALEVGRAAIKFNPGAVSGYLIVLSNPTTPINELKEAQKMVLQLDPLNEQVRNLNFK
jgi:O-antigen ligase